MVCLRDNKCVLYFAWELLIKSHNEHSKAESVVLDMFYILEQKKMPKPFSYKLNKFFENFIVTNVCAPRRFSEHLQAKPLFQKKTLPF